MPEVSNRFGVVMPTGEIIEVGSNLTIEQAMQIYPQLDAVTKRLRSNIERWMDMNGSVERSVPGAVYEYKPTVTWKVDGGHLRQELLNLTDDPDSCINQEEIEQAIQTVVFHKANNTHLNTLAKRSAKVREAIDRNRSRVSEPARLKLKEASWPSRLQSPSSSTGLSQVPQTDATGLPMISSTETKSATEPSTPE